MPRVLEGVMIVGSSSDLKRLSQLAMKLAGRLSRLIYKGERE